MMELGYADNEPVKRRWIRELSPGKTFADVGGLGGAALNEMVTSALDAGASQGTLVDVLPLSHAFWTDFENRCRRYKVVNFHKQLANLDHDVIGPFDVVHCSGLIYHAPNPVHQLTRLRAACRESLVFTSMVIPTRIGAYDFTNAGTIFVPALQGDVRLAFAKHFDALGIQVEAINMDLLANWIVGTNYNFGPWWWLFTADVVESMLAVAGFKTLRREETWKDRAMSWLCRAV